MLVGGGRGHFTGIVKISPPPPQYRIILSDSICYPIYRELGSSFPCHPDTVGYFSGGFFSVGFFLLDFFSVGFFSVGFFSVRFFSVGFFSVGFFFCWIFFC